MDAKDRNKEQEELEELKNKIFSGEFENPSQEYERAKKEHEKLYRPQIIIDVNQENMQRKEREQERNKQNIPSDKRSNSNDIYHRSEEMSAVGSGSSVTVPARPLSKAGSVDSSSNEDAASRHETMSNASSRYSRQDSESRDFGSAPDIESMSPATPQAFAAHSQNNDSASTPPMMPTVGISLNLGANTKKKRIESTAGVFSNDDDNDDLSNPKKRKLVPLGMSICLVDFSKRLYWFVFFLDYEDNQTKPGSHSSSTHTNDNRHDATGGGGNAGGGGGISSSTGSSAASGGAGKGGNSTTNKKHGKNDSSAAAAGNTDAANSKKDDSSGTKVHDEKRRHIKSIIDRIPTQKEDLFNYKLDRNEIDNNLMERKIRPWINKKIIEYIGEPEPTLVDFICSKVLAGSSPQSILDDVQMVR